MDRDLVTLPLEQPHAFISETIDELRCAYFGGVREES